MHKFTLPIKIKKWLINRYEKMREYLANHKRLSIFLSHGGLHLSVLIILIVSTIWLGVYVYMSSIPNTVVIDTSFEFLGENNEPIKSPVTRIYARIIPGSVSNKDIITICVNHGTDSLGLFDTPKDALNSKVYWNWDYYGIYHYNLGKINIPKADQDSINVTYHDKGYTIGWKKYSLFQRSFCNTSGKLLGENSKNPYYSVYFKINCGKYDLKETSEINIDLSGPENPNTIITFENIVPNPSQIGINKFSYKGKDAVESVLYNGGFYFDAKNTTKAHIADRLNLIFNVLMGTLIAFILDIIINLIYKWRRLGQRKSDVNERSKIDE